MRKNYLSSIVNLFFFLFNDTLVTNRFYLSTILFIPKIDYPLNINIFFLTIILFIFLNIFFNKLLEFKVKHSIFLFFCLSLWCLFVLKYPLLNFIFSMFFLTIGIIPMLSFTNISFTIPFTKKTLYFEAFPSIRKISINLIKKISFILKKTFLLNFLEKLHEKVFYTLAIDKFTTVTVLCISFSLMHLVANRSLLFLKEPFIPIEFLHLIIFFSAYFIYIRLLISLSIIVINSFRIIDPELIESPLLRLDPLDPNNFPQKDENYKFRSIFSFNRHNHNHNYPAPKAHGWGRVGIIGGVLATAFSGISVYYLREQTLLTEKQNSEFKRQNDLEEVNQGFMTKEEYERKWKQRKN